TKLPSGRFLLGAHNSLSAQTLDWYVSSGTDLTTTGWSYTGTNVLIAGYQNINLINQCDGHVYMAGTFHQPLSRGWVGDARRMRLYDIATSGDTVTNGGQIADKQMQCGTAACEFAAAAGVYVTPGGSLLGYSSRGYVDNDILQFVEFQQIPTPIEVET